MEVETRREAGKIVVDVMVTNDQTGHHVPTDSPLRQMILLVTATSLDGLPLVLVDGPMLPDWCGVGDPAEGYYAGLPGKAYAKILQELWTELLPSGAYWNPTRVLSDTRLAALASDRNAFAFQAPEGAASIDVTLWFRRAYKVVADQKGWTDEDILMERAVLTVP